MTKKKDNNRRQQKKSKDRKQESIRSPSDFIQSRNRKGKENKKSTKLKRENDENVEIRKQYGTIPLDVDLRVDGFQSFELIDVEFPRRQPWSLDMEKEDLEEREEIQFEKLVKEIHSRHNDGGLSPFDHNIEVWRELWRTIEKSDVICLTCDVRSPLLYIRPLFYEYIVEELQMPLVIVLTKVDLIDEEEHLKPWIKYLEAHFPKAKIVSFAGKANRTHGKGSLTQRRKLISKSKPKKEDISHCELEGEMVLQSFMDAVGSDLKHFETSSTNRAISVPVIGIVGCPNTGKSSLMNAILKKHVVSVSRSVGHTKHFQTHFVKKNDEDVCMLIDSPGLIFPTTVHLSPNVLDGHGNIIMKHINSTLLPRQIYEISGLFPIAQIREAYSALRFVANRLDVERLYNLKLDVDDYGDVWSPYAICGTLADKKGYTVSKGGGAPDFHRAGLEILTDILDGVLLVAFQPPEQLD